MSSASSGASAAGPEGPDRPRPDGKSGSRATPALQGVVGLAARAFGTPIALVSLVEPSEVRFIARLGLEATGVPRADWLCDLAIRSADVTVIADIAGDGRFARGALVVEHALGFYAGAPVTGQDGHPLGTVCVIDRAPRHGASEEQIATLRALAQIAGAELERVRLAAAVRDASARASDIIELVADWVWETDADHRFTAHTGDKGPAPAFSGAELIGWRGWEVPGVDITAADWDTYKTDVAARRPIRNFEYVLRDRDGRLRYRTVSARPVHDGEGRFTGYIGATTDITARREAERGRLEAERHYREIVDTAQEGVGLIDAAGVIEYVNPRLTELLGIAADQMVGRGFSEFLHPDGPMQAIQNWFAAPRDRIVGSICLRRSSGAPLWVKAGVSARLDDRGAYRGTLAMITDLTSVRRAEERRRETESSFRYLFELNPNPMWVFDDETMRFLAVNEAATARFGYSREEFLALTIYAVRPQEERHRLRAMRADYNRQTANVNVEGWVFVTRAGERFEGELTSYSIEFDGRPARVTVIRDVTARKAAEAVLREREANFRYLFDHNPNPMIVSAGKTFRVLAANEAALRLYGYTRPEFISLTVDRIRAPEVDDVRRQPPPSHGPGVSFARLSIHRRKSGDSFPVDVRGSAIMFDGRAAWLIVVHDISEQQRAQARLAEAEDRLRQSQKLEAVGHLTGGIAHDFNNLLTVILGNIELLQDELPQGSPGGELLSVVARAAERGADLTSHLLAFARRQSLAPHEVDVNVLLGKMHALLARSIGEHIVTNLARGRDVRPALIDPTQLETAVLNLVVNARDAMPDGGTIDITTSNAALAGEADAPGAAPVDYVAVSVADTGTGMSPDVLAKAFDPFFTTKETGKGSGLGLSMVYGFVRQSGGQVRLVSAPGKGTTVTLYLPCAPSAVVVPTSAGTGVVRARGGSESVLVVEDDPPVRRIAEAHLRSLGYRVLVAGNGIEALAILKGPEAIDLMLSDVVMPGGIDGRQLALQARQIRPGLRILLASGYLPESRGAPGGESDDLPLLHKPYRRGELAQRVRALLDVS